MSILARVLVLAGAALAVGTACAPRHGAAVAGAVDPRWGDTLPSVTAEAAPPALPAVAAAPVAPLGADGLRLGPNDLLEITVFEAPELSRSVRVGGTGVISLPLLGEVAAAGLTPRELEQQLEQTLRARYIRDPHVSVQISEMQSHAVSVVGAVAKPGVFQIRESRPLLELIAMAGGLSPEAGETAIVVRGDAAMPSVRGSSSGGVVAGVVAGGGTDDDAGAALADASITVSLRALLESGDTRHNVTVGPGDLVKVSSAGLVYVVGEVRRPGAFPLARRPGLTVLQAVALGEGLGPRAARGRAMIIRTGADGARVELPVDLGDVFTGRAPDVPLLAQDVVFVPSSAVKVVATGVVDALVRMVTLRGVF